MPGKHPCTLHFHKYTLETLFVLNAGIPEERAKDDQHAPAGQRDADEHEGESHARPAVSFFVSQVLLHDA